MTKAVFMVLTDYLLGEGTTLLVTLVCFFVSNITQKVTNGLR